MLNQHAHQSEKKPLNIGIVEVRRHPAVLYTFCKICSTSDTTITVFTTPELFARLKTWLDDTDRFHFIIKKKKQSLRSFLRQIETYCETKLDAVFVNTIHETWYDLFHFSKFNPTIAKILTVHHVNAWLHPQDKNKKINPFRRIINRMMKPTMQKIINHYDAINVIYPPLKDYIKKVTSYQKPVFTLPSAVFEEKNMMKKEKISSHTLTLIIPGLVQQHRKDFETVLSALRLIPKSYLAQMKLILLGTAFDTTGKQIIKQFQDLSTSGLTVETFYEFIDDETFYTSIQQSDILFLPIKIHTRSDNGVSEIYGKSVGSGVVYDAIKYAKPVIIPKSFDLFSQFNEASLKYDSSESLKKIIIACIENPSLVQKKQQEAVRLAQAFSLKDYQQYFERTILPWIQKQKQNG